MSLHKAMNRVERQELEQRIADLEAAGAMMSRAVREIEALRAALEHISEAPPPNVPAEQHLAYLRSYANQSLTSSFDRNADLVMK